MSAFQCEWSDDLRSLASEWEGLADRVGAGPFQRPGWISAWWTAFGKGRLQVLAARSANDGVLRAVLPLRRRLGTLSSPTNWHSPEFGLLTEQPEAASFLLASLLNWRPRRVALDFLDDPQADLVEAAVAAHGYRVIRRVRIRSPYVSIAGGWIDYERFLGRKLCADLRRRQRLLGERGLVTFEVTSGERLDALLDEGFRIEGSGWKSDRGTAICSQPVTTRFYADIARWAAERGWLRLAFLRLDGQPLAFNLCLECNGTHYLLKNGFDPAYRELAPGKLLRHQMLARAFESGLKLYEFLGESSPSKLECTRTIRPRSLVQGFSPGPLGMLDWSAFAFARPFVKRMLDKARRARAREAVAAQ